MSALRADHAYLYWFVASAWNWLACTDPAPGVTLDNVVDLSWHIKSETPTFDAIKLALRRIGATTIATQFGGTADIVLDGCAAVSMARRDKVLLVLYLWFAKETRWYTQRPPECAPDALRRVHDAYQDRLARHISQQNNMGRAEKRSFARV